MYFAGIDIGGMSIKIGLVSLEGKLIVSRAIPTNHDLGYEDMVRRSSELISELCKEANISTSKIKGIGVGIPGTADSSTGIATSAVNIGWKNTPVSEEFSKYFDVPIIISNDANCAALGEQKFGSGAGYQNLIFITLGTGVGSGIIIDGKLVEGVSCAGAESGHMVIQVDGELCNCGRCGCWECYASATALIKQTKAAMQANPYSKLHAVGRKYGKVTGRTAFLAAQDGDDVAQSVVDKYIKYVATGLINLANIIHPEAFIIGGGISHEGDYLMKPLQQFMDNNFFASGMYPTVKTICATLGNNAGIIGAAALVM